MFHATLGHGIIRVVMYNLLLVLKLTILFSFQFRYILCTPHQADKRLGHWLLLLVLWSLVEKSVK